MKLTLLEEKEKKDEFEQDIEEISDFEEPEEEPEEQKVTLETINKKLDLIIEMLSNKSTASRAFDQDVVLTESLPTMLGTTNSPLSGVQMVGSGDIRDEMFGGATGAALGEFGNNGIPSNMPFSDVTMISSTDENI